MWSCGLRGWAVCTLLFLRFGDLAFFSLCFGQAPSQPCCPLVHRTELANAEAALRSESGQRSGSVSIASLAPSCSPTLTFDQFKLEEALHHSRCSHSCRLDLCSVRRDRQRTSAEVSRLPEHALGVLADLERTCVFPDHLCFVPSERSRWSNPLTMLLRVARTTRL